MAKHFHLVIPNLLGIQDILEYEGAEIPAVPTLMRLLSKADAETFPYQGAFGAVARLTGLSMDEDTLPVAALGRMTGRSSDIDGGWLRADPSQLIPDMDRLVMGDPEALEISTAEAESLIQTLNEDYQADGWHFEADHPSQWSLHMVKPIECLVTPLTRIIGHDIHRFYPAGEQNRFWRARLNEIQMTLHAHPVNELRRIDGRPLINTLWFWGGGSLPEPTGGELDHIVGSGMLMAGLAHWAGIEHSTDASMWTEQLASHHSVLVCLDTVDRPMGPHQSLDQLLEWESTWFEPLRDALSKGKVETLWLYPGDGRRYRLRRSGLRRFWRRTNTFSEWLRMSSQQDRTN